MGGCHICKDLQMAAGTSFSKENIILYDNQPWEPQMDRLIQIEA